MVSTHDWSAGDEYRLIGGPKRHVHRDNDGHRRHTVVAGRQNAGHLDRTANHTGNARGDEGDSQATDRHGRNDRLIGGNGRRGDGPDGWIERDRVPSGIQTAEGASAVLAVKERVVRSCRLLGGGRLKSRSCERASRWTP